MSSEPPPTYNTPVFNQAYWGIQPELGPLDNRYLQFPNGQGTETIPSLVVANQIAFSYSSNPTIGTTSLGYFITGTGSTSPVTVAGIVVSTISNLPVGVFIISFIVSLNAGFSSGQYAQFLVGTTVGGGDIIGLTFLQYNGSYSSISGSAVYKNTTTRNIYLNGYISSSNIGVYSRLFQAVRIA